LWNSISADKVFGQNFSPQILNKRPETADKWKFYNFLCFTNGLWWKKL
jgi:hypothetical protein